MKAKILAGAIGALFYGTSALASDGDCPPPRASAGSTGQGVLLAQSQDSSGDDSYQEEDLIIETQPVPDSSSMNDGSGMGGSGQSGQDDSSSSSSNIGGSGQAAPPAQGEVYLNMPLRCQPANQDAQQQGTGGSGSSGQQDIQGLQAPPPPQSSPQPRPEAAPAVEPHSESYPAEPQDDAIGGSGYTTPPPSDFRPSADAAEPVEVKKKNKNDTKGVSVLVGGGVEGYTGALAPQLKPGPTAGVTVAFRPSSVFGLELGYTGALNNLDSDRAAEIEADTNGPDLVRNGGTAVATLSLFPTAWQPYVLGGIGISDYSFRHGASLGYKDDAVGTVPAGVGLRGHVGHFTVDARANYNFLFDKDFAPGIDSGGGDFGNGGSYQGTVSVGGTF